MPTASRSVTYQRFTVIGEIRLVATVRDAMVELS